MKIPYSHFSFIIIGLGVTLIILTSFYFSQKALVKKQEALITEIENNYQPSVNALLLLNSDYDELINLIRHWALSPQENDSLFRKEFHHIFNEKIHPATAELTILSDGWDAGDSRILQETTDLIRNHLFNNLLKLVLELNNYKTRVKVPHDIALKKLEEGENIFLMSEIEQNLSYLIDKKKTENNGVLGASRAYTRKIITNTLYLICILIVVLTGIFFWNYKYTYYANNLLSDRMNELSEGHIPTIIPIISKNAFSTIFERMNQLTEYFSNLVALSTRILNKDFSEGYQPVGKGDQLGNALLNIQHNIKQATLEEEKRIKEDYERNWVSAGIARVNDILRFSGNKIDELSFELLKEIVNYTDSKLGAIFIVNNEDPSHLFLEIKASYAYERRKHIEKQVAFGEGLVGRCAKENESIYLTEIPDNYLSIKSGLGGNNPVSILIIPLKISDIVYGVIELASFHTFDPYQIRFMENIGINIATTISKVKINQKTSSLLEQTRRQAEELLNQEEEMRQSMEELRATQEQSTIREEKLKKEIDELKAALKK